VPRNNVYVNRNSANKSLLNIYRSSAEYLRDIRSDYINGASDYIDGAVVVCCKANMKDFVAANKYGEAVFMKISISTRNFRKAISKNTK